MCRINCSGGCPECAPEEHLRVCVAYWEGGCNRCICDPVRQHHENIVTRVPAHMQGGCGCEG
jgi:hypothetical protein